MTRRHQPTVTTRVADSIQAAINAGTDFTATARPAVHGHVDRCTNAGHGHCSTAGRDAGSATITVTADAAGASRNGVTVTTDRRQHRSRTTRSTAAFNGSGNIEVQRQRHGDQVGDRQTRSTAWPATARSITASTGDSNYIASLGHRLRVSSTLAGGVAATGGFAADVVFELAGATGSEVFSFGAGTSIDDLVDGINLVNDATGVEATVNGTTLELNSIGYGSTRFVDLRVISEGTTPAVRSRTAIGSQSRDEGTDVVATVNGIDAKGNGNALSINTATLDLQSTVAAGFTGTVGLQHHRRRRPVPTRPGRGLRTSKPASASPA